MTEDEFWIATPAETDRRVWAWRSRQDEAQRDAVKVAHLTVSWYRAKRLPPLKVVLAEMDGPRVVSDRERADLQAEHERLSRELGER
jgi:hypothetical protein